MNYLENFLKKANLKHNNKFNYSKFTYVNAKTKSIIICPEHGDFLQNPDKHLNSVYACMQCQKILKSKPNRIGLPNKSKRISKEEFVRRFYKKFDIKYKLILDDYNGMTINDILIECPLHGVCEFSPNNMRIVKTPCIDCSNNIRKTSKTKSYEYTIEQLNIKHNNKYTYLAENKDTYINKRSNIVIICPLHGQYIKSAQKHLSGQECFDCRILDLVKMGKLLGGYSDEFFKNNMEKGNEKSILYYISVGKLYKIGITTNLQNRLKSIKSESRNTVDIILIKEYNLIDAYNIEQSIIRDNSDIRTYRKWSTELFEKDITDKIKQFF